MTVAVGFGTDAAFGSESMDTEVAVGVAIGVVTTLVVGLTVATEDALGAEEAIVETP